MPLQSNIVNVHFSYHGTMLSITSVPETVDGILTGKYHVKLKTASNDFYHLEFTADKDTGELTLLLNKDNVNNDIVSEIRTHLSSIKT